MVPHPRSVRLWCCARGLMRSVREWLLVQVRAQGSRFGVRMTQLPLTPPRVLAAIKGRG